MELWKDLQTIRERAPLVHNITNFVVMNTTANALLALGASPVMAHAAEEVEDMVALASSLVINIGTLTPVWVNSMLKAGKAARRRGIPVVLDPVGSGATAYRTETAVRLMEEVGPQIVRGNASEIASLVGHRSGTKGVDSTQTPDAVLEAAHAVASGFQCVTVVSGAVDVIVNASKTARIANGHPMMPRVTGLGCTSSALCGAFAAVNRSMFEAAWHGMAVMGIAGELAGERAAGPGSFQMHLLDALYQLSEPEITGRVKCEIC